MRQILRSGLSPMLVESVASFNQSTEFSSVARQGESHVSALNRELRGGS